jgi:hypothetical protein
MGKWVRNEFRNLRAESRRRGRGKMDSTTQCLNKLNKLNELNGLNNQGSLIAQMSDC